MNQMTDLKLNPLSRIPVSQPLRCELILSRTVVELPDARFVDLLLGLSAPTPHRAVTAWVARTLQISDASADEVVADLVAADVLVDAHAAAGDARHALWIEHGWGQALQLHYETRELDFADADAGGSQFDMAANVRAMFAREGKPVLWKRYPLAPVVELPAPDARRDEPVAATIQRAHAAAAGAGGELDLRELATMLHVGSVAIGWRRRAIEQLTDDKLDEFLLYSSWSQVETYVAAHAIPGLDAGLYHYDLERHRLARVADCTRAEVVALAADQRDAGDGACAILLTAVWPRYMYRYRHARAYRNLLVNLAELDERYRMLAAALGYAARVFADVDRRRSQRLLASAYYDEGVMSVIVPQRNGREATPSCQPCSIAH
jgi:hypothetical protein